MAEQRVEGVDPVRILKEMQRIDGGRWVGVMAMYSPLLPLMLMLAWIFGDAAFQATVSPAPGGGVGPGPASGAAQGQNVTLSDLVLAVIVGALFLSLFLAVIGVCLRCVNGVSLSRAARRRGVESLGAEPAPIARERLGLLIVTRASESVLTVRTWRAPRPVWGLVKHGFSFFMLAMAAGMVIAGAIVGNLLAGFLGAVFVLGWWYGAMAMMQDVIWTARRDEHGGTVEITRTRPYFMPSMHARVAVEEIAGLLVKDSLVLSNEDGKKFKLDGFTPGAVGRWQARRLALAMATLIALPINREALEKRAAAEGSRDLSGAPAF